MNYKIEMKNNIRYITIPELTKLGLKHCFTTIDMDMGMKTNPSIEDLKSNLEMIYEFLNIKPKVLFNGFQTHSKNITNIKDINQGMENELGRFFPDTDGLVTDFKDIAIITRYADCNPIILFDSIKGVHCNIHSGWKGTLQRIAKNGVEKMVEDYGCNVEDIIAIIGPTIGKDDFEVEQDVMNYFKEEFDFHKEIISKKNDVKYLIDIQKTNKKMLLDIGIKEENITIIELSTMSNPMFHSYRRDGDKFGLMGCVTCLQKY